ncbi:BZ3500_MvSof-1268-A1-R1_Chr11-1g03289 [Microbotryum saponariae]|uniref:BZ3500_MvSof-1268-A1-R1_Chr11-1g03289 protein n=1 Tax=Microbotryum saponariae TaxID=289078 RepID=A0A2X0LBJ5_9BASI|nr:BZ3501_MvSof-1269-A2-R1_Chr11g02864 [Microbotryum saponariae]SDA03894.1 BZ3500_MvSof-1268-A1-R1_Chr11-1g03289 [Microbotryum saponariae]
MGSPLRVLLDKHDRFMPATISAYYRFLYENRHGCEAVHYPESETIWHAVSEATWIELEAYLDAFVQRRVRDDWKDLRRSHYVYDPLVYQIEEWIRFCIHANRKWYIEWYNKKYRKVRPALHLSDNLVVKLLPYGGLRSWADPRRDWFRSGGSILNFFHPGHLSNDEIKHLRRKGVHFGLDPVVGFEKIVDTRAESSTEVLGLPELLPDSKPAETAKAEDDLSKSGQQRARTLPRL